MFLDIRGKNPGAFSGCAMLRSSAMMSPQCPPASLVVSYWENQLLNTLSWHLLVPDWSRSKVCVMNLILSDHYYTSLQQPKPSTETQPAKTCLEPFLKTWFHWRRNGFTASPDMNWMALSAAIFWYAATVLSSLFTRSLKVKFHQSNSRASLFSKMDQNTWTVSIWKRK